jgi:hypothetical protein
MWSLLALVTSSVSFADARPAVPEPGPTFDVVSVKVNEQGGGPYPQALPGRLILTYYSVQDLVALAYGLRTEQVVGKSFSERYPPPRPV